MLLQGRGGGPGLSRSRAESRPPSYRGGRRGIQPVPVAGSTLHRGPHAVSTGRYASTSRPYSPRLRRGTPYRVRRGRTATSTRAPLWAHVRAQLGPHTGPDPLEHGRRYTTSGRRQSRAPCRLAGSMPYHLGATPPPTRRACVRPGGRSTTCYQALPTARVASTLIDSVLAAPGTWPRLAARLYRPPGATAAYSQTSLSRRPGAPHGGPCPDCVVNGRDPTGPGSTRHVTTPPERLA